MKNLYLILVVPFLVAFSPMSGMAPSSLDWQKIELEKSVRDQVVSTISPIIRSGEYVVNVNATMTPGAGAKPASGGAGGAGGGDKNKQKKKKPAISFNDIDPKEAKGDYIVMSKLGLEAPLYQENAPVLSNKGEGAEGGDKSEAQQWQKFLSEYMNNNDLFKLLQTVTIDVKLDNYLGEETKKTVEELLNGMNLSFGDIKATVKISYIDMKEMKKELDKRRADQRRELYEWIGRIGQPLGIILGVLLLGIFAFLIFRKYAELQEKQMEMMKDQMSQQKVEQAKDDKKEDNNEELAGAGAVTAQGDLGEAAKEDGMERFRAMLLNNPIESSLMIKRWIKDPTKMHQVVLNVLVKELSGPELAGVFESISLEERKVWKRFIGKALKPNDVINAKRYIGSQVVQEMIIPNSITDTEAVELLIRINPEESALFCEEDPKLASILMSVMNAKFLSKMMDKLSEETVQTLLQESISLTSEKINSMLGEFKLKISKHVRTEMSSPFMEKLVELIPLSSPQRERTLYQSLAQGSPEKVLELVRNYFPSELIFSVPDAMMKTFTQSFPREKRPELVLVMDESNKQKFIDIIAPNQKSKDMLTLDLEKYEMNEILKKKVMDNKDTLMKEFIDHCRKNIRSNPSHLKELEPVISEWMGTLGVNLNGENDKPHLRAA